MVKGGSSPGCGGVALLAGLREVGLHMAGIGRALEIRHVAGHARSIAAVERVVAIHVTLRTRHGGVEPSQRKAGCGVVKAGSSPVSSVVALLAGLREVGLHVVRIVGGLEIGQVAGHASCVCDGVVVVDVALRALHAGVGTRQRESGGGVIELGRHPRGGVVALLTSL